MEFHRGRLIDHVHLRARDLDASRRFYRAVLRALGREDAIREGADSMPPRSRQADATEPGVSAIIIPATMPPSC